MAEDQDAHVLGPNVYYKSRDNNIYEPTHIQFIFPCQSKDVVIKQILSCNHNVYVLTTEGQLFFDKSETKNLFIYGEPSIQVVLNKMVGFDGKKIILMASSDQTLAILTNLGELYMMGSNFYGQLSFESMSS